MSRIGKQIIPVPEQVTVEIVGKEVKARGPLGELSLRLPNQLDAKLSENILQINRTNDDKTSRSLHGLYKVLSNNLLTGVSEGFKKSLEFKGIGYRVAVQDNLLTMSAGYSHPIEKTIPEGIKVNVQKSTITVSGIDKYKVGEFAAEIREIRKPEVYKGKGIRYSDEHIKIKPGKTAAKG